MADKIRSYEGEDITVTYSVRRCIHAEECVRGLPGVFDPNRRPWIDPDQAAADELAGVVMLCPTGALQFTRKDGGVEEPIPDQNTVTIDPDGPLYLHGNIEITLPDGSVHTDTRVALCRCGATQNRPFCDNSHAKIEFKDPGRFQRVQVRPQKDAAGGPLKVRLSHNGPLLIQGPLELVGSEERVRGGQVVLCRCGGSANKPFCDGTHNKIGFTSE
ncbi:MAG: CDGSH iron-sulfur domain-containing protein [Bacteroidetes bacterium]|nr:CDGSH iron-sulfur domain-containing protein [Bacteroidota bacterium]